MASCSKWLRGKKLPDEYGDIALFRVSPLQPCINGLHKMETEGHEESKHGFSDEFCQRYCRFLKFDWCSYIVSCHCYSIISEKIFSFNVKIRKPKPHMMRKIHSAVYSGTVRDEKVLDLNLIFCLFFEDEIVEIITRRTALRNFITVIFVHAPNHSE